MVRYIFGLAILLTHYASAEIHLEAHHLSYENDGLVLNGGVMIEQPMGKLTAETARLTLIEDKAPSFITAEGSLHIQLPEKGDLYASRGNFDCQGLRASFFGDDKQPMVVFDEVTGLEQAQNNKFPLHIESPLMIMNFCKSCEKFQLTSIEVEGGVNAIYNRDLNVKADRADYNLISGLLYLHGLDKSQSFAEIHQGDDLIKSRKIQCDLNKKQMVFEDASGKIKNQLEVSAQQIIWDGKELNLQMVRNVSLKQPGMGDLSTPNNLFIQQCLVDGKKQVAYLSADSDVTLSFIDKRKGFLHNLKCPGPLFINNQTFQVNMTGLSSAEPIFFSNLMGEIYADQAMLSYKIENGQYIPVVLHMEGHVKIINRYNGHENEAGLDLQNILADSVDYYFDQREMRLSAQPPQRVLIFDRVKNMQMSAPAFVIKYDEALTHPTIHGLGQTRLKFAEKELQQMKNYFQLKDTP